MQRMYVADAASLHVHSAQISMPSSASSLLVLLFVVRPFRCPNSINQSICLFYYFYFFKKVKKVTAHCRLSWEKKSRLATILPVCRGRHTKKTATNALGRKNLAAGQRGCFDRVWKWRELTGG
jgi:hypothetical protein